MAACMDGARHGGAGDENGMVRPQHVFYEHPKMQEMRAFGFQNELQLQQAFHVYLDLLEVKNWFAVSLVPCNALQQALVCGRASHQGSTEVILPMSHDCELDVSELQSLILKVQSEHSCNGLTLALTDSDSTIVYYKITDGFVPPDPPESLEKKKNQRQQKFQQRKSQFVHLSRNMENLRDKVLAASWQRPGAGIGQSTDESEAAIGHPTNEPAAAIGHPTNEPAAAIGHPTNEPAAAIGHPTNEPEVAIGPLATQPVAAIGQSTNEPLAIGPLATQPVAAIGQSTNESEVSIGQSSPVSDNQLDKNAASFHGIDQCDATLPRDPSQPGNKSRGGEQDTMNLFSDGKDQGEVAVSADRDQVSKEMAVPGGDTRESQAACSHWHSSGQGQSDLKPGDTTETKPSSDEADGHCSKQSVDSSPANVGSPDDLDGEGSDSDQGAAPGAEGGAAVAGFVVNAPVALGPQHDSDQDSGMDAGDDDDEDEGFEDEL